MLPVAIKKILPALVIHPAGRTAGRDRGLYVRDSDFLAQDTFRQILCFERKRAERTRRPLCALLLHVDGIEDAGTRARVIRHIAQRASDMPGVATAGWYESNRVIGIIASGGQGADADLPDRVLRELTTALPDAHVRPLRTEQRWFPDSGERKGAAGEAFFFYPDGPADKKSLARSALVKRAMDILGGLAGLLLFSPLFLLLPVLIKATSRGPVLFRQERVGQHGRPFVFLKFRSMAVNNDPAIHREYIRKYIREQKTYDGETGSKDGVYKIKDDPRVTALGRFLRKTSLDELPQFLNVLRGDMSLVGPRPPIPYELENYEPWHRRRVMEIKPGITGLWQVSGRSSTTFDEMVRLDLAYAEEWSLWMDLKILLKTPWAAVKGAY
jgi:lipopolysaccharide/colanic/teichoic acid biosynthesis glycosyltransferase